MGYHEYICEADRDYWREHHATKKTRQRDTVVVKHVPSPYKGENFWILDGKMTTDGLIDSSDIWHMRTAGTVGRSPPRCYNKLSGNRALDICSSYGISTRELLAGHSNVHVLELQDWYARIVEVNLIDWGYKDRISVKSTKDFTHIDYTGYDSVRFGIKAVEYLFYNNPTQLMTVKNIAFEFDVNQTIVDTLLEEGYRKAFNYTGSEVFTKA